MLYLGILLKFQSFKHLLLCIVAMISALGILAIVSDRLEEEESPRKCPCTSTLKVHASECYFSFIVMTRHYNKITYQ